MRLEEVLEDRHPLGQGVFQVVGVQLKANNLVEGLIWGGLVKRIDAGISPCEHA